MKLLLVFHSIFENSGMENLLLGIKELTNSSITIIFTDQISESIKENFNCIEFENITKNQIKSHDCLIYFKEYRKEFDFTNTIFKNIKKICAIFYPVELSEKYSSYNFHLASSIITNFKTNLKKLDSITNLEKFHIHQAYKAPRPITNQEDSGTVGIIGSKNNLQIHKIIRIIEKTGKKFEFFSDNKDFYEKCESVIIHNQDDFLHHLHNGIFFKKKIIINSNIFTKEFKNLPVLYYEKLKDIYEIIISNKITNDNFDHFIEITNVKNFVDKLEEIVNINLGFNCHDKRVSYFDSGTFVPSNWMIIDNCLSKVIEKSGTRFFAYADREIRYRPESLNDWVGFLHQETNIPEKSVCSNKGVFVFSEFAKENINIQHSNINVENICYPTIVQQEKFNFNIFKNSKKIYCFEKHPEFIKKNFKQEIINAESWNRYLVDAIVYLNFTNYWPLDILTECIEKNVPVITKRHPITEEYLGANYPLFNDESIEINEDKILEANIYLKNMDKTKFRIKNFINSILKSKIYQNLSKNTNKPLFRITLGRTSKDGYEVTHYSIKSIVKCYGINKFDLCLCHNNINQKRLRQLENKFQNIKAPIRFYKQSNSEISLPIKFTKGMDATMHHAVSFGSFWKICPARLRPDSHEIIMDNDIVFLKPLPELDEFLKKTIPLTLEDSSVHMGVFEKTRNLDNDVTLNSGIIGLPPNYNFEKKLCSLWESTSIVKQINGGDEQGLLTSVLSKGDHILIPRSHVIGLNPEKLHVNAFSSGTPSYHILKRKTERDFINYFRVDMHKLMQKTFALHFYQINRSSVKHRAWDKFLNCYRYMQFPNSLK